MRPALPRAQFRLWPSPRCRPPRPRRGLASFLGGGPCLVILPSGTKSWRVAWRAARSSAALLKSTRAEK